jgi:hypothetical protein
MGNGVHVAHLPGAFVARPWELPCSAPVVSFWQLSRRCDGDQKEGG